MGNFFAVMIIGYDSILRYLLIFIKYKESIVRRNRKILIFIATLGVYSNSIKSKVSFKEVLNKNILIPNRFSRIGSADVQKIKNMDADTLFKAFDNAIIEKRRSSPTIGKVKFKVRSRDHLVHLIDFFIRPRRDALKRLKSKEDKSIKNRKNEINRALKNINDKKSEFVSKMKDLDMQISRLSQQKKSTQQVVDRLEQAYNKSAQVIKDLNSTKNAGYLRKEYAQKAIQLLDDAEKMLRQKYPWNLMD